MKQVAILQRIAKYALYRLHNLSLRLAKHATVFPRIGNLNQYAPRKLSLLPAPRLRRDARPHLPSISIITPSFNQAAYIERTINSVLQQDYPHLEYFVQDGGSVDGTVTILESFGQKLTGWHSAADHGQSHAINLGFARTSGEIMGWLNSDDLLLPGALKRIGDFFAQYPDIDVVYGNRLLINEDDLEIGRWLLPGHDAEVLSWADYIPQETLFWRRTLWNKVGTQVDESFRFAMDWDLLLRFRDAGACFAHLPHFLGAFRIHTEQKTSAVIHSIGFQEMDRIRLKCLGRIPSAMEIRRAVLPFVLRHIAADTGYRVRSWCAALWQKKPQPFKAS